MGLASKVAAASAGQPASQGVWGATPQAPYDSSYQQPQQSQYPQQPQQQDGSFYPQLGAQQPSFSTPPQSNLYPSIPGGHGGGYPQQQQQYGQQQPPHSSYPQQPQWGAPTVSQPPQQYQPQTHAQQQQYPSQHHHGQPQQMPYGTPQQQPQWGVPQQQQQQHHNQPPPAPSGSGGDNLMPLLQNKLNQIITVNRLQHFYPPQRVQQILGRLSRVDLRMKYADNGERVDDLKLILQRVSEVATLFDDDGISIRAMNADVRGDNIRTAADAERFVGGLRFSGMMDKKILQPFLYAPIRRKSLQKPLLVITITDGEPTNEPEQQIFKVVRDAKRQTSKSPYGSGAVAFQFAQVGKDAEAQAFLGRLDTDAEVGAMVDATSYYELEAEEYKRRGVTLTPELWLVKLMVGAIDPTYDEQDE